MLARFMTFFLGSLAAGYAWLVFVTSKKVVLGNCDLPEQAVFAVWHGRAGLVTPFLKQRPMFAMVSNHKDGQFMQVAVRFFGRKVIVGSTKTGALGATKALVTALKDGGSVTLTPDAPPLQAYEMAAGVLEIARMSRLPLVLCAVSCKRGKQLQNRDRYVVPRVFFNTLYVKFSAPIFVGKDLDKAARGALLREINADFFKLTQEVDAAAGQVHWS